MTHPKRDLRHWGKSGILSPKAVTGHQGANPIGPQDKAVTMIRFSVALVAVFGLTACGGGTRYANTGGGPVVLYATGPIQKACQAQGRASATRARCGCVQAVADRELSNSDQRRGARYFKNPHALQVVRQDQSNNASNRRFWAAWKAYGERAAQLCSGT